MRLLIAADEHDMRNIARVWISLKLDIEERDRSFIFPVRVATVCICSVRDVPVPHPLLLIDVWPYYIVCVAFASVLCSWLYRHRGKRVHVDRA
jgi:hypothetical protein